MTKIRPAFAASMLALLTLSILATGGCKRSSSGKTATDSAANDSSVTASIVDKKGEGTRTSKESNDSSPNSHQQQPNAIPGQNPTVTVPRHPQTDQFQRNQLNNNHTLFVMGFDSITRQDYFLGDNTSLLTPEQISEYRDIVDSYESDFSRLLSERATILENAAMHGDNLEILLFNNRVKSGLLGRKLRSILFRDIMNAEQKKQQQLKTARFRSRVAHKETVAALNNIVKQAESEKIHADQKR